MVPVRSKYMRDTFADKEHFLRRIADIELVVAFDGETRTTLRMVVSPIFS